MVTGINLSQLSDIPIYRQIVTQLTFMIEMGQLRDGDRLPASRLLADNLGINRNTVAHAYRVMKDSGLVEARGRKGMVVVGGDRARSNSQARDRAHAILTSAVEECAELGMTPSDIQRLVTHVTAQTDDRLTVSFVECNRDRAEHFATELEKHVGIAVKPLVLGEFDDEPADLVLTTFFHLAEVRALLRGPSTEIVAIVVAPHVQTLLQIAEVPKHRKVGLLYSTEDQAASIRDSLAQAGLTNTTVLTETTTQQLNGVDLVVVPSELPGLKDQLAQRVPVIEFGNVLDAASLRMVGEVVRDLRATKPRQ